MATCADLLGVALPEDAGEDSVSLLPLLRGEEGPRREHVIHHSSRGVFAVRQDEWVYIDGCGGDVPEPDWWKSERNYVDSECPAELYNLTEDISERRNLYREHPELVTKLKTIIETQKQGRYVTKE